MSEKAPQIDMNQEPQEVRSQVERAQEDAIIDFREAVESTVKPVNPWEENWQEVHNENQQILSDLDEFESERPYIDAKGKARTASGEFARADGTNKNMDDKHYESTLDAEKRYEDLKISELADEIAWSEVFNDTTRIKDLEDVLVDKMIEFAEANDMDVDAQDNLQNRVLRLVETKKQGYLANPDWLKENGWKGDTDEAANPEVSTDDSLTSTGIDGNTGAESYTTSNDVPAESKPQAAEKGASNSGEEATTSDAENDSDVPEEELTPEQTKEQQIQAILAAEEYIKRLQLKIQLLELELGLNKPQQEKVGRLRKAFKRMRNWRSIVRGTSEEDLRRLDDDKAAKAVANKGTDASSVSQSGTAKRQKKATTSVGGGAGSIGSVNRWLQGGEQEAEVSEDSSELPSPKPTTEKNDTSKDTTAPQGESTPSEKDDDASGPEAGDQPQEPKEEVNDNTPEDVSEDKVSVPAEHDDGRERTPRNIARRIVGEVTGEKYDQLSDSEETARKIVQDVISKNDAEFNAKLEEDVRQAKARVASNIEQRLSSRQAKPEDEVDEEVDTN